MKQNKNEDSESSSGFGTIIVYILVIYIGLTYIDKKVTRIGFVNKINTELFGSNKNNQNNSSNENNTESSYTNSSESSTQMGSEIPNKFFGTWESWDGKYRFRINILRDNETKEKFKNGSPQSKLDYVKVEVSDGHRYTFFYNTEQDKLESFWDATKGDIIIDENSGNLLLENNEFSKVK